MNAIKPSIKPQNPLFGSGPTAKNPYWSLDQLSNAPVGRSHRSLIGKERLRYAIEKTRDVLEIPQDYLIGIIPGSATGAIECALWNTLGPRPIDIVAYDAFGLLWLYDAVNELKLNNIREFKSPYGEVPEEFFTKYKPEHDTIVTVNGTTSGTWIGGLNWIDDNRQGLTIADATSAVGCMELQWSKLDITAFSWQKAFGGEGGHGMLALSPRAVERIESYIPNWPIPRLFRLKKNGKINEAIFRGETINTPSMLCVEDYIIALEWAESLGGIKSLTKRTLQNFQIVKDWVEKTPEIQWLCKDPKYQSPACACFTFKAFETLPEEEHRNKLRQMALLLGNESAAFDIVNHLLAPPSLRLWCGPTVEPSSLSALLPWISWAYYSVQ